MQKSSKTTVKVAFTVQEHNYGGATKFVLWTLQELVKTGHETLLISNTRDTWLGSQLVRICPQTVSLYCAWIQRAFNPLKEIGVVWFLYRAFRREKPDIIALVGAKLIVQGGIAAWLAGVPKRFAIIQGLGAPAESMMGQMSLKMFRIMALWNFRFVTVSDSDYHLLRANGLDQPHQVEVVHNGTDVDLALTGTRGRFRSQLGIPENALVVGMIGRLVSQKSYEKFVPVMAALCEEFPDVYGLLVGDGPLRDTLQAQIDATGFANRIRITGYVAHVPDACVDLDVSVLFTRYEGLALSLLESAAAGLPIVATDVCSNNEVVIPGETGFLVHNNAEAVSALRELLLSAELRQRMGQNARSLALQRYDYRIQIPPAGQSFDGFGKGPSGIEPAFGQWKIISGGNILTVQRMGKAQRRLPADNSVLS